MAALKGANLVRLITPSATAAAAAHHLAFNFGVSIGGYKHEIRSKRPRVDGFPEPSRMEASFWKYMKTLIQIRHNFFTTYVSRLHAMNAVVLALSMAAHPSLFC